MVAGPVAFVSARAFADAPDPNPEARFVDEKTLVVVRADRSATIAVPAAQSRDVSLDYDYGTDRVGKRTWPVRLSWGVRTVKFIACPPGARPFSPGHSLDRETQFNGGIVTRWGRCIALDVFEPGRDEPHRAVISMGAGRCPAHG